MNQIIISFLLILFLNSFCVAQSTEKRIALVIGNARYTAGHELTNPVNDANLMVKTLNNFGFEVISINDANKSEIEKELNNFANKLNEARVSILYYSGHGIQDESKQYIVPVDANPKNPNDIKFQCIDIQNTLNALNFYPDNLNIVILDACRTKSFPSSDRSWNQGFTKFRQAKGMLIAYATARGETAYDNPNESNGLYTKYLALELMKPLPITQVFKNTKLEVQKASNKQQRPLFIDDTTGDFYIFSDTLIHVPKQKSKNIWMVSALVSSVAGTFTYVQSESAYKKYQSTTADFDNLYKRVRTYDLITPIAFVVSGFCTLKFIQKSIKGGKAKRNLLNIYPRAITNGGGIGLVYNY